MARNKFGGHPLRKWPKPKKKNNSKLIVKALETSINKLMASKQVLHRDIQSNVLEEKRTNDRGLRVDTITNLKHLLGLVDKQLVIDSKLLNVAKSKVSHNIESDHEQLDNVESHIEAFSTPLSAMCIAYHEESTTSFNENYKTFKTIYVPLEI